MPKSSEIEKLSILRAKGLLSDEEFERERKRFFAVASKPDSKSRWGWWPARLIAGLISFSRKPGRNALSGQQIPAGNKKEEPGMSSPKIPAQVLPEKSASASE